MNKNLYFILLLFACPLPLLAQSGIGDVLESIEANNTTLRAGQQLNQSQKLEARTGKFLPNPSVELNQLWAGGEGGGKEHSQGDGQGCGGEEGTQTYERLEEGITDKIIGE